MSSHHALCRSVGSGIPFSLGAGSDAVTVLLQPMRLKDWGVLEQLLLLQRKNSIQLDEVPEGLYETLAAEIREDRSVTIDDLISFAGTQIGASWRLWLSLRQEYTYEKCASWIDNLVYTNRFFDYQIAALQIDGLDIYAELDWPKIPHQEIILSLRGGRKNKNVDWKVYTNSVAEAYSIAPNIFGELTYYQARLLLCDRETLAGTMKLTMDEAKNLSHILSTQKLFDRPKAAQQNAFSP